MGDGGGGATAAGNRSLHRWRRRFGIAALIAAVAWWPLAALVEWSPVAVAVILGIDAVLVVALTTAWYALVDLRTEPYEAPAPTSATTPPVDGPGCLAEGLMELGGYVVLLLCGTAAGALWRHDPAVAISVGTGVVVAAIVGLVALERRSGKRSASRHGSDAPR